MLSQETDDPRAATLIRPGILLRQRRAGVVHGTLLHFVSIVGMKPHLSVSPCKCLDVLQP